MPRVLGTKEFAHEIIVVSCAMNILRCVSVTMTLCMGSLSAQAVDLGKLDDEAVMKYVKALEPRPSELWRTIPWKVSLMEAQAEAAKVKKPLFIWAMDGHPLACV